MYVLLMLMFFFSLMSMLFLSFNILSLLISIEMMILSTFSLISLSYHNESIMEIMMFMVMAVTESILGLTIMLTKVKFNGNDKLSYKNIN